MVEVNKVNMNSQVIRKDINLNAEIKAANADISKKNEVPDRSKVKYDQKDLKDAVDIANKMLFKNNTHLKFEIHEKTKEVMVKIINDESGEVVKEIPPEKMLDMAAKLWEIAGIIVDERR